MSINNLYTQEERARILAEVNNPNREYHYFTRLAEAYRLAQRLEKEIDLYQRGELKGEDLTSDREIAKFFGVKSRYSVQNFLGNAMNPTKRDIKARVCLESAGPKGWPYLRDSGKIPPLEGRVRDAAIRAIKKKWAKTQKK